MLAFVGSFAAGALGSLVGLVLGSLRLPAVLLASGSPAAAAGTNIAVSAAAAFTGGLTHARAGRVSWRLFAWMAPPSLAGAVAGGLIAGELPGDVLLVAIGLVVLYGAWEVARYRRTAAAAPDIQRAHLLGAAGVGFGVGLLGGFVGLILGSMRLPAMVKYVGMSPYAAVGTNAAVGVIVGIGGLVGHLPSGVDWDILWAGAAGGVPGAYLGSKLTGRLDESALIKAMATVLVITGAAMILEGLL